MPDNPFVGAVLGLLIALVLMRASKSSFSLMTAESGPAGLALVAMSLFARLVVVTVCLIAYKRFFETGFKPFALFMASGFLVLYTVEVVRYSGLLKRRPPASARS